MVVKTLVSARRCGSISKMRNNYDVREFTALDGAFGFLAPAGVCGAKRIAAHGFLHAQPLLRHEAALGLAFRGLTCDGGLHSLPWIQRHHRPIASKRQTPTVLGDALPGPSPRSAVGTGVTRPHVQSVGVRIRMQRLHAGDDAELAEASAIGSGNRFDVLDARAAVVRVITLFGALISIQSRTYSILPNRVREKL